MASEFSKGKTLVVLAIVIGCFAILWPKIFYPMFQASVAPTTLQQQPIKEPAGHMRPERPPHLHPDMMHPALREKGRVIPPTRTIEKQAKPGPMPGMRPPMGGAPHIVSPSQGSGGMGILMPIYTIGIVVFFLYTMMKIMFKKPASEEETIPRIKDFHMDAEHRKYLFAEEYCSGVPGAVSEMSVKEYAILQEQQRQLLLQEQRRSRSKTPEVFAKKDEELKPVLEHVCQKTEVVAEESVNKSEPAQEESVVEEIVEEVIIPRSPKMDTEGKPIGQWYLPPGFASGHAASDDENETGSDDIDLNDADERSLRLAFAALKAQKEEEVDQLRRRLEETERAMERICRQMGDVTDKLSTSAVADLLTPQLSSDKAMAEEAASAAAASKGSSPDMDEYEVIQSTRPAESSETSLAAAGAIASEKPTSTNNDS